MKCFALSIGDINIRLVFKNISKSFFDSFLRKYSAFLLEGDKGERFEVDVLFVRELPCLVENITMLGNPLRIVGDFFVFEECDRFKGNLFLRDNIYCFENFLRSFISYKISFNNGILIHSAGAVFRGSGMCFGGESGSGKTTISKMIEDDFSILSDEICALRLTNEGFCIYSTPFWGNFKKPKTFNQKAILKVIFMLSHSRKTFVRRLTYHDAFKRIMRITLNFSKDLTVSKKNLEFIDNLVRTVDIYDFYFSVDKSNTVWFLLDFLQNRNYI